MTFKHNKSLVPKAKDLRNNMTKEERHLWYDFLRSYPIRFQRQKIIEHYIADFYCAKAKLVVELDGSQHYEEQGMAYDAERSRELESFGITVVRIPNNEIFRNFEGVCQSIDIQVNQSLSQLR